VFVVQQDERGGCESADPPRTIRAAAPSLSGQQLPAVTYPSGWKTGFELRDRLVGDARTRAVVGGDDRAVGQRHRGDLVRVEALVDGLLGEVLRANAEPVHLLPGHSGEADDVLGGLPMVM
jgi:hypothetical protein